jgi:hypothetical protein
MVARPSFAPGMAAALKGARNEGIKSSPLKIILVGPDGFSASWPNGGKREEGGFDRWGRRVFCRRMIGGGRYGQTEKSSKGVVGKRSTFSNG